MLTKPAHIKYENNAGISQWLSTHVFMTCPRKIVNLRLNISMKAKLNINLNQKSD